MLAARIWLNNRLNRHANVYKRLQAILTHATRTERRVHKPNKASLLNKNIPSAGFKHPQQDSTAEAKSRESVLLWRNWRRFPPFSRLAAHLASAALASFRVARAGERPLLPCRPFASIAACRKQTFRRRNRQSGRSNGKRVDLFYWKLFSFVLVRKRVKVYHEFLRGSEFFDYKL